MRVPRMRPSRFGRWMLLVLVILVTVGMAIRWKRDSIGAWVSELITDLVSKPTQALVGKPAPDFTLTVLDGPGRTKKVSKADLAGKVVMIDFWATWCSPCLKELPEVAKMMESYAAKNAVIVALSQDEGEGGVREKVEETLRKRGLDLQKGSVGMVALDPTLEVGEKFKVSALPAVIILDSKGVVQSVHIGLSRDLRSVLSEEIDTLLDGKSLVDSKAGAGAKSDRTNP
jgi:thiol-disulfide isomerase/thioredoxin